MRGRRTSTWTTPVWAVVALGAALLAGIATPDSAAARQAPNIVLITSDDQPLSTFQRQYMPRTFEQLVDRGTNFTDAVVNVPLCCPSRATLLTGQYPHNHNVLTNDPGYSRLRDPGNVLPTWLRKAGYRTGHFGKWLHGYERVAGLRPAPGWSRWLTQLNKRRYYDYALSSNGRRVRKGQRRKDHLTTVMTRAAARFIGSQAPRRRPLFMQLDYYAPHVGPRTDTGRCANAPEPSPRDAHTVTVGGAPRGPSFNEADISDKPAFFRLAQLGPIQLADLDRRYRCTLESVAGLDRGIGRIVRSFREAGELRDTAFVFLTDNGFSFGEHRVGQGKARPWEESIRTPLVLRLPRGSGATESRVGAQVAEIDVVPTILELAGAEPCRRRCRTLDGRSLIAASRGKTADFEERAVLVEMDERSPKPRSFACSFRALRTSDSVLIQNTDFPDPETQICERGRLYEHYEIGSDPFQLENRIGADGRPRTARQRELRKRLRGLRDCAGIKSRDPRTPGGFCE